MDKHLDAILNSAPEPIGNTVEEDANTLLATMLDQFREKGSSAWQSNRFDLATMTAPYVEAFARFLEGYDQDLADGFKKLREDLDAAKDRYNALGLDGDFNAYQAERHELVGKFWKQIDLEEMQTRTRSTKYNDVSEDPCYIQLLAARSLTADPPEGYFEMDIPIPEGLSSSRIGCLKLFVNRALTANWQSKKNALNEESPVSDYPPGLVSEYEEGGDGRYHVSAIKLRSQQRLTTEDLGGIEQLLAKEFTEFRQGWRYQCKGNRPAFAYAADKPRPIREVAKKGHVEAPMFWKFEVLQALEADLKHRGILGQDVAAVSSEDEEDDHQKTSVRRRVSTRSKSFASISGEAEIVALLKSELGVETIALGGREGRGS